MEYTNQYPIDGGGFGIFLVLYVAIVFALSILTLAGLWKMYAKAGRPGWSAIVPVYNWWVWIDIIERPKWWFWAMIAAALLSWIPLLGVAISIGAAVLYLLACLDMAKRFRQGTATGIGLWILPFVFAPMLGFGSARFQGGASPDQGISSWPAELRTTDTMDDGAHAFPAAPNTTALSVAPIVSTSASIPSPAAATVTTASAAPFPDDGPTTGVSSRTLAPSPAPTPGSTPGTPRPGAAQSSYMLAPRTLPIAPLGLRGGAITKS